jgi:hypothetical protein
VVILRCLNSCTYLPNCNAHIYIHIHVSLKRLRLFSLWLCWQISTQLHRLKLNARWFIVYLNLFKFNLISVLFFLWLYSPILGLGRLHETFRFISISRSRTVGRTPWTGDQLVARPLLTTPGDCDDGEVGGMNDFGRGNRSTRKKPAPTPLCPQQIPLARPGREPGSPRWEASD